MTPDFRFEQAAGAQADGSGLLVAGLDEVGRGPLAGPVVAAAVILTPESLATPELGALNDSKKLTAKKRAELFELLSQSCYFGLGEASVAEIECLNIRAASLLAMQRAVLALPVAPASVLVDGRDLPALACPAQAIIKGDSLSLSIAAASILAKVSRDRRMAELAERYPAYGWERNQGYGTPEHLSALRRVGVSPWHRKTFRPIYELIDITN